MAKKIEVEDKKNLFREETRFLEIARILQVREVEARFNFFALHPEIFGSG